MLEIRHLRTLRALRSAGSLVRAAEMLHLTQSALSHQVKLLEDRFGAPLFERKSLPVVFTAAGSRLLALADQVLPSVEQAERDVARMRAAEPAALRLALDCPACFEWLLPVLAQFRLRWPDVAIDVVEEGAADLVLGGAPDWALFRQEWVLLLPARHPLGSLRRLAARDLRGQTLLRLQHQRGADPLVDMLLAPAGIDLAQVDCPSVGALAHAVACGRGIAVLPRWAVQPYLLDGLLQARPLGEPGAWPEFGLRATSAVLGLACVADLAGLLRAHAAEHLRGVRLAI
ncbi:LysR substrate-binding domain-containing protein [Massilia sp. TS11]|uniref:LysR substrate-binding domain-containing protein n=1 Tax=Massilia sp. TS11 TaxID=2908003 RepID=UPI001EDA9FFC|nr:LysR substrate-binding domain-containing protein [Massilia sp. TS11]MCG2585770.1 LysR substrate-binding domain-containing protein [Massilia sp. TS11]